MVEKSGASFRNDCVPLIPKPELSASRVKASAKPVPYEPVDMSTMVIAPKASDGMVRRKNGYLLPSLRSGLVEEAEMIGTLEPAATCAAVTDAEEQPAPMSALTPWLSNASLVRCIASIRAREESHFESL
eukprot:5304925-Prymnesium_polylepis.1